MHLPNCEIGQPLSGLKQSGVANLQPKDWAGHMKHNCTNTSTWYITCVHIHNHTNWGFKYDRTLQYLDCLQDNQTSLGLNNADEHKKSSFQIRKLFQQENAYWYIYNVIYFLEVVNGRISFPSQCISYTSWGKSKYIMFFTFWFLCHEPLHNETVYVTL